MKPINLYTNYVLDTSNSNNFVYMYSDQDSNDSEANLANNTQPASQQPQNVKKTRKRRYSSDEEPIPKNFKPCVVCGETSNGYHFGVASCEGCKGFFRRTIVKRLEYKCRHNKTCVIDTKSRVNCQYCRFQKCLDKGMAKNMVKGERLKMAPPRVLSEEDIQIVKICSKLYLKTLNDDVEYERLTNEKITDELSIEYDEELSFNCDEFTQNGIRKCIKFCMNLPGNSELTTNDRAKLLKYGIYEIALLRLAYRYDSETNRLKLSNSHTLDENDLESSNLFGSFGKEYFQFCKNLSRFSLKRTQLAVLCAMKFFTTDRPFLNERSKIKEIQTRYIHLFECILKKNQQFKSKTLCISQLILSLINLRGLDVLTANSMFEIVNKNEKQINSNPADGFISELLKRNIVNVNHNSTNETESE